MSPQSTSPDPMRPEPGHPDPMRPGPDPGRDGEQGVVLLLVTVLIVVAISSAYAMAKTATLQVMGNRQRMDLARTQMIARSGLAIAQRALLDDLADPDELRQGLDSHLDGWAMLGEEPIAVGAADLWVRVADAGSRIAINALVDRDGEPLEHSREFLTEALRTMAEHSPELRQQGGLGDESSADLADGILDWIDRNEETRLGSPEQSAYGASATLPVDRPVLSLAELADVPGMTPLVLEALGTYFTPYPLFPTGEEGGVNLNTAPPHVLALVYHGSGLDMTMLNEDDVYRLLESRRDGRVFCTSAVRDECVRFEDELRLAAGEVVFPPLSYTSDIFRVAVEARHEESARACLSAIVDRGDPEGFRVLYYELGC